MSQVFDTRTHTHKVGLYLYTKMKNEIDFSLDISLVEHKTKQKSSVRVA